MRISNSVHCAFSIGAAIAMLVGCASQGDAPSTLLAMPQSSLGHHVVLGFTGITSYVDTEHTNGKNYSYSNPCPGHGSGQVKFAANGNATGPYPGPFGAGGSYYVDNCNDGNNTTLKESFTIISGAKTVNGSFSGAVLFFCLGGPCNASWRNLSYTATLTVHGKVRKTFHGLATGHDFHGAGGDFSSTLTSL